MNCIDLTPKGLRRSKRLQGPPRSRIERECDVVLREVLSYCGVASFMVLGETCNLLRRRTAHLVATGHVDRTLSVRHNDTGCRNGRDAIATLQAISLAGLKKQLRHSVIFDFPAYGFARKFRERARYLFRKVRSIPSIGVLGIQYLDMPPALDLSPSLRVLTLYRCNGKVAVRKMKRMWLLRISEPDNGDGTLLANVHSPPPNLKNLQYTANCNTYTEYLRETRCTMRDGPRLQRNKAHRHAPGAATAEAVHQRAVRHQHRRAERGIRQPPDAFSAVRFSVRTHWRVSVSGLPCAGESTPTERVDELP